MAKIRKPAVAGTFYPASKTELQELIDSFLTKAEFIDFAAIRGLVVPHAGYIYSGPVAASAYKQLLTFDPEVTWKIFLLGASHHASFPGLSIDQHEGYETPLGVVPVDQVVKKIIKEEGCDFIEQAHTSEHSLEVQLPFLQKVLKKFSIIPILVSETDYLQTTMVVQKYLDEKSLLIASSDLSHYYEYKDATMLDQVTCEAIENQNIDMLQECEACGKTPIMSLLQIAQERAWKTKLVDYRNSGDISGELERVVGYGAFVFYEDYQE